MYIIPTINEKEAMNMKERTEGQVGYFEGRKEKECNYITISKNKKQFKLTKWKQWHVIQSDISTISIATPLKISFEDYFY